MKKLASLLTINGLIPTYALLTVDLDDLFGPWQVTVCFLVNCKDRRVGA